MLDADPQPSPMVSSLKLTVDASIAYPDPTLHRQIVGALQYLILTRINMNYVVNKACQYMYHPQLPHWRAVKPVLHYFVGTITHGLHITPSTNTNLCAFTDADWGSDPDDQKSITVYCIFMDSNLFFGFQRNKKLFPKALMRQTTWAQPLLSMYVIVFVSRISSQVLHTDHLLW